MPLWSWQCTKQEMQNNSFERSMHLGQCSVTIPHISSAIDASLLRDISSSIFALSSVTQCATESSRECRSPDESTRKNSRGSVSASEKGVDEADGERTFMSSDKASFEML